MARLALPLLLLLATAAAEHLAHHEEHHESEHHHEKEKDILQPAHHTPHEHKTNSTEAVTEKVPRHEGHHEKEKEKEKEKERAEAPHEHTQAVPKPPSAFLNSSHLVGVSMVESGIAAAGGNTTAAKDPDAVEDFLQAFFGCFFVILATEVGDKTFFIAAILTMRHSRAAVWSGAMGALIVMTVLSAVVGHAAPLLISPAITHYAAVALFLLFGIKMLRESRSASSGVSEELEEVEQELTGPKPAEHEDEPLTDAVEEGAAAGMESEIELPAAATPSEPAATVEDTMTPIVLQAFTLTFVAEWGDRSQIATIAMGADQDIIGVTLGGILGHACCTSVAVLGGKLLATRISEQAVLLCGGSLFLLFSFLEWFHGPGD